MKIIGLISPRHQPCCQKASDEYFSVHHVPFSWSLPPTLPSPFLPSLSSALLPYFSHPSSLLPSFSFLTSLEDDLHIYFSSFLPDTIFVSYLSKSSLGCVCRSFLWFVSSWRRLNMASFLYLPLTSSWGLLIIFAVCFLIKLCLRRRGLI